MSPFTINFAIGGYPVHKGDIAVLIPAYKPDGRLNTFLDALSRQGFSRIVVVDDGGGTAYARIFDRCRQQGAQVISYAVNRGKGAAMKTGMQQIMAESGPTPVITADCDGQHHVDDIARMAIAMMDNPDSLVLGTRDKRQMPPRSRTGNTITCAALGMLTGLWISDTQTGLRGIPASVLKDFIELDGDRYEYEMNMLIRARQLNMSVIQQVIQTIYIDDNKGSHFDTLRDSARIYALLFKQIGSYIGSGLISGVVEYVLFLALHIFRPEPLWISIVIPRIMSALLNYTVNRQLVFKSRAGKRSILYFYLLVGLVLALNYSMILALTRLGVPTLIAKPITDALLFVVSYNVQQRFIFRDRR